MIAPAQQLDAIHAMLTAGHRNLRIERHTLLLWGVPAGLLFAVSESILTPAQFPDLTQRALAWLALLVTVLLGVGTLDWFWTRKVKQVRDEAWSFIHRQVIKVFWLMMGLATLTTFATFFYGGGYMLCAVWLVFLGISIYVHGLFSEELLEWAGALTIVIGIASLFARMPYETMRWVAASVFGLGLPLLAMMLDRGRHRPAPVRLLQMLGWLTVVLVLPVAMEQRLHHRDMPEIAAIPLAAYLAGGHATAGEVAVALPAGTRIPVDIELGGDIFSGSGANPVLPLTLNQPIELLLRDGKLTGDVRFPGQPWQQSRQVRWLAIPWLRAELTPEHGPRVAGNLVVQLRSR